MTVQLMSAGKFRARIRNLSPTGEKHRHTCRYRRTLSRKKSHKFSGVSKMPASFTSFRTALHISSFSSFDIRSGMYPEDNKSLMYTRKRSWTIWLSVIKNVTGWPLAPAFLYSSNKSTLKSAMPYEDVTEIWKTSKPQMNVARRASDCLPLPPTPTSMALPRGRSRIRVIRVTWSIAWLNSTRSITALLSLCSFNLSTSVLLSFS